jgi:hypothetical protein
MPRFVPVLAVALVVACGGNAAPQQSAAAKDTLTQRQRDSAIGASKLPGAKGIGAAQRAADSLNAQNARLDSIH